MKRCVYITTLAALLSVNAQAEVKFSPLISGIFAADRIAAQYQSLAVVANSLTVGRTKKIDFNNLIGSKEYGYRTRLLSTSPDVALAAFEYEKEQGRKLSRDELTYFCERSDLEYYKEKALSDPDIAELSKNLNSYINEDEPLPMIKQCGETDDNLAQLAMDASSMEYAQYIQYCAGGTDDDVKAYMQIAKPPVLAFPTDE